MKSILLGSLLSLCLYNLVSAFSFSLPLSLPHRQFSPAHHVSGARTSVELSSSLTQDNVASSSESPELGGDGIFHIDNKKQHTDLLQESKDSIVVLKVFAPWCRACKGLAPKFSQLVHDSKYNNLPIKWADLSIQHNKEFVQSLGILALPTVQIYVGGQLIETFPCGPSKVPILKRKLAQVVNEYVDASTYQLKPSMVPVDSEDSNGEATPLSKEGCISDAERRKFHTEIPYFRDLSLADLDQVMDKAESHTFEPGSIIMREGKVGKRFYIIRSGEVEICQKTLTEDPLTTPTNYLGSVVNRLEPGDYFGERALITGEPRAASIRATEQVKCWAFHKDIFPRSSPLSGYTTKQVVTDDLEAMNDKYGVNFESLQTQKVDRLLRDTNLSSQKRGSVNNPRVIKGVDTDDELEDIESSSSREKSPLSSLTSGSIYDDVTIFSVLNRFRMIQHVNKCFSYIKNTNAIWGQEGIRTRRSLLVDRLTPTQRTEFRDAFHLLDRNGDGTISMNELRVSLASIGESRSDDELIDFLEHGHVYQTADQRVMNIEDFMGLMAEAEFFYLFRDIFASLDKNDTGFVKAKELDQVLCGVRDLISDDRKSIIDVEDHDMLIDYQQFSRMLLGTALT